MIASRRAFAIILGAAALTISACANQTTSYRTERFGEAGPRVITQDAKTRNLVMMPPRGMAATTGTGSGAQANGADQWRVCAEAAPDVFSALSASGSGAFGLNTRGAGTEAQAQAAMAIAESAATIERTQTINLLRESMYRTCERYLSGAIDQTTFVVQAGRDWRAMIAILAIEQLTRAVRQPSTVISGGATAANLANSAEIERQLGLATAEETAALQEKDAADLMTPGPAGCPATNIPPANTEACALRATRINTAALRVTTATRSRQNWLAAAQATGVDSTVAASTRPPTIQNPPPGQQPPSNQPSDAALAEVAGTVESIVTQAFETDETQLFCLQTLTREGEGEAQWSQVPAGVAEGQSVRQLCIQYLAARVQNDISELHNWHMSEPRRRTNDNRMRTVEAYLRRGPGTPGERWNALISVIRPNWQFGDPIEVPANASLGDIREKMLMIGEDLQTLVDQIGRGD